MQKQTINVTYTPSARIMADGLTKALPAAKWPAFLDQIGLKDARDLKTEEPTILDGRLQNRLDSLELLKLDE
jgi:hypothetical protein